MIILLACSAGAVDKLPTTSLTIEETEVVVELADEPEERHRGLMHRKTLGENEGMLFVYPQPAPRSFWMENTSLPLCIAFLDETGRVINVEEMKPFDRNSTPSGGDALYALEMNKGWFDAHGVETGSVIRGLPGKSEK
ncbi:MAG TPA: DUF192 domain-containing protein [Myxococcota bacterium]|nr:DUF192 domain-containing protein [Myxococcota bacterium]